MNGHANGNGVVHHQDEKRQQDQDREQPSATMNGNGHAIKQAKVGNGSAMVQPAYDPAPRTLHYEFLGPPGALGISLLVPLFTYFFAFGCDERGCPSMPVGPFLKEGFRQMQTLQFYADLWDTKATIAYLAWYAWCVVCWAVLPGPWIEGSTLRNGEKLWYKINGELHCKAQCSLLLQMLTFCHVIHDLALNLLNCPRHVTFQPSRPLSLLWLQWELYSTSTVFNRSYSPTITGSAYAQPLC